MELFVTNHAAKMYAAANGNNAVEYRANSSDPWAVCSPICAWNPAPFEYRKAAQRWIIDAETAFGPVIRRVYSHETDWHRGLRDYLGHKVTLSGGRHARVSRMKTAKWEDVPRLTRVILINGAEFEFLGVSGDHAVLLKNFTTHSVPFSDTKLSPNQPKMVVPDDQPGFLERLHDAGFGVLRSNNNTFRIICLREGWRMEA
jgi:hypothetical protein